jgi:hypothetical protein
MTVLSYTSAAKALGKGEEYGGMRPTFAGFPAERLLRLNEQSTTHHFLRRLAQTPYDCGMVKRVTDRQILGELGETAIKKLVLEMRFIYEPRGRLEAGTDGLIELRLLRRTVERQTSRQLLYLRKDRLFYFRATGLNKSRSYGYVANVNETSAKVVSAYTNKKNPKAQGYVRHHAASFRFERLADEWLVVVDPTFYFTQDGFQPHRFPEALLAGKKRLERNAALRGQVVMWQYLLVESGKSEAGLFDTDKPAPILSFATLPLMHLSQAVPEASWTRTDPRAKEMESRELFE